MLLDTWPENEKMENRGFYFEADEVLFVSVTRLLTMLTVTKPATIAMTQ